MERLSSRSNTASNRDNAFSSLPYDITELTVSNSSLSIVMHVGKGLLAYATVEPVYVPISCSLNR